MKSGLLTLVVLLTISSFAKAQDTALPEAHLLSISSRNTAFAVVGDFEGEYRVYPDRIEVRLTKAEILINENCPYKGRTLVSFLKLGLAVRTDDNSTWKIARRGNEFRLERMMLQGDSYTLGALSFNIPIDDSIDLSKHWLVVQIGVNALDVLEGKQLEGYTYAHSCTTIFTTAKCPAKPAVSDKKKDGI